MEAVDRINSPRSLLRILGPAHTLIRGIGRRLSSSFKRAGQGDTDAPAETDATPALKIARYSLVLMDSDGQVVWTRDYDSGGVFEFGPRQRLWVFCGFTNHSESETEISEYEIELMGEDGLVVERFGDSFGDSVIIPPGE